MCSEQGSGFLVLLVGAAVVPCNVPFEFPVHTPAPYCQFQPTYTGRDEAGIPTYDYEWPCWSPEEK